MGLAALDTRQAEEAEQHARLSDQAARAENERGAAEQAFAAARMARSDAETETRAAEQAWDAHSSAAHNPVTQLDAERTRARYAREQRDKLVERRQVRRDESDRMSGVD